MFPKKREINSMKSKSKISAKSGVDKSANDTSTPTIEETSSGEEAGPSLSQQVVAASPLAVAEAVAVDITLEEPAEIEPEAIDPDMIETLAEVNAPEFGIADAIRLMRSLPTDSSADMLVRVVRLTLGAVNVSVDDIMQDAARKERAIRDNLAALRLSIGDLERQLEARRAEAAAQESELSETLVVKERLRKYAGHRPPPTPLDAAKGPRPNSGERSPVGG